MASIKTHEDYVKLERSNEDFLRQLRAMNARVLTLEEEKNEKNKYDPTSAHELIYTDRVNGRTWTPPVDWDQERIVVAHTLGYNQRTCV